jgi:hypothetical protein
VNFYQLIHVPGGVGIVFGWKELFQLFIQILKTAFEIEKPVRIGEEKSQKVIKNIFQYRFP